MQRSNPQQDAFRIRLPLVMVGLILFSLYLLTRLAYFQYLPYLSPEVVSYLDNLSDSQYNRTLQLAAARGLIYDRNGEVLAVNMLEYEIGVSPNLVEDGPATARQLGAILNLDALDVKEAIDSRQPWISLARPVSAELAQQIDQLDLSGVTIDPIPRRGYPQGALAAHLLGFVNLDLEGHYGIEGYYQELLAGQARSREVSNIPFELSQSLSEPDDGRDIYLTIDRDIQFAVEAELKFAIESTGAESGTIIVMDPRSGEILGMANYPSYDPNAYFTVSDPRLLQNPAVTNEYEPGSVMKVLTIAAALENGTITPDFTYYDEGVLSFGGIPIYNWDRQPHGNVTATQILIDSLNIGAATVSTRMGPEDFYKMFTAFGIGRQTGVDLENEAAGTLHVPGDPDWSESMLATNSFGQGVAVTPLQMLTSVNAIANGGLMMQPRMVYQIRDGVRVSPSQPSALARPISAETARIVTEMMVATVNDGIDQAQIPGYSIAGKSGTAEIPNPVGYESGAWIMSFVGFFPADAPQISVLVKLDRPTSASWASQTAAPVFQRLARRLVILLEIPPDDVRHQLASQGGAISGIRR